MMRSAGRWMAAVVMGMGMGLGGCVAPPAGPASTDGSNPTPGQRLPQPVEGRRVAAPPPRPTGQVAAPLRESAKEALLAAAKSTDPVLRMHAIEGMRESLGSAAKSELIAALSDPEPMVKFAAAMACGELRLREAEPTLRGLAASGSAPQNPHLRIGLAYALHRLGDTRNSLAMETGLKDADAMVRANAAFALGRLGEKSATRILRPALKDSSVEVRLQAAEALWRLGDEEGLRHLVASSLTLHPGQQMVGILALAGPRDDRVMQHVRAGMDSAYLEVALVTARALGILGSDEWFMLAMESVRAPEARQRALAALALGSIGRVDAQDALGGLLKDGDADVRIAAATALLQLH